MRGSKVGALWGLINDNKCLEYMINSLCILLMFTIANKANEKADYPNSESIGDFQPEFQRNVPARRVHNFKVPPRSQF
jgi:hypothetical protein